MQKSDFHFHLPPECIAQTPAHPRDASRLMCMQRATGRLEHHVFHELPGLLAPGDLLVLNNSKVLPARLIGEKPGTGGVCELLLLREIEKDTWACLAKPGRRIRAGSLIVFGDGTLEAQVLATRADGSKEVRFCYDTETLYEKLDQFGKMPLPPYIHTQLADNSQYQTVYAKKTGSSAAPTAGLHFTQGLLARLALKGIQLAEITLHVGLGTFLPVKTDTVEKHQMHSEWYSIGEGAADKIQKAKSSGHRVIAVGTTSCRTLEAAAQKHGKVCASSGDTDIFIYPGYSFQAVDGLITNFHLPESTLIMLVSAFCGREQTLAAYQAAIESGYRFFSFGDAMLIL
ncbi:MAG: tRNA preQ1(34) S-adenosylmethionine ribosyltransferase-isomerase QueA [Oscillospiraceae bacterium]